MTAVTCASLSLDRPRWRLNQLRPAHPVGGSAARPSLPHRAAARRPAIRDPRHPPFGGCSPRPWRWSCMNEVFMQHEAAGGGPGFRPGARYSKYMLDILSDAGDMIPSMSLEYGSAASPMRLDVTSGRMGPARCHIVSVSSVRKRHEDVD